jgi:molybdopterin converting factor small subunit
MSTADSTIAVTVSLRATLRKFRPDTADADTFRVDLPDGCTVGEMIDQLAIPRKYAKLIFVNHVQLAMDDPLVDGSRVELFPPIAGG